MICPICHQEKPSSGFKSGVVDGEYIPERCGDCFVQYERPRDPAAAQYKRERDREDNARDIIQPFLADGVSPNPEFAHAYPGKAKELYYTKEQLEDL